MADIVKEIQSLGGEIDSLRKKISDYDKQISNSGKSVANIERLFASYKGLDASAMSVKELTKATKELTNGYNSLTAARDGYVGKESATLELIQKLAEQNKVLAAAQREALRYGDQQGATEIYQQYVANSQAIRQYQTELDNTRGELEALEEQTNKVSKASDNFALISQAAKKANSTKDIAELVGLYKQEVTEVKGINEQIQDYSQKYKAALAAVKGGKLTPEQMDEKTMELEGYKNKLDELSNAYNVAAQRARIFANSAGENTAGIPQMAVLPMEIKPKQVEFPQIKELQKEVGNASDGLDGLLKKGAKLGGLTYGAHKLKEFAQQVMSVRSEFQQLEVAFSTLLGSEQKANKLMAQLTKTAATTPFDLQSISRGAKQLLAYGTAAEDVNDILVHLGDIAAGLSQPLDALVYLYGTTMVQGRMMTMDLRQFQNRGIPIAEELAKQFGVAKSEVAGLVSAGRVSAEDFHKAIISMSSEGGKFGGLMAAQAKTIGGQISNIQDNISMMFNEIGKKSEGVINAGLGAVATLVENYETVGKTILALIATYGTYKTALIVVTALEKAKAATALYNLVSGQKAISVTKMLTTATWKQVKAQLASNAAMLANPAIWITTAIVGLVAGTIAMARALDSERKAQDKLNKSKKEQQELLDNAKSESDSAISTLQSETATAYEKAKAYDTLKRLLPQLTDNYTQAQIASMSLEQAQKAQAKALEDLKFEEKRKEIEKYRQEVARLQQESSNDYIDTNKIDALGNPVYNHGNAISNANLLAAQEAQKQAEKELAQMEAERKKAQEQEDFQKLPIAKQIEQLKAEKQELQDQFDGLQFKADRGIIHPLELTLLEQLKKDLAGLETQIDTLEQAPDDLGELTNQILDAEKAVDVARKTYAANMSEGNKTNVDTAVANLKTLTDKYKDATGQQWTATEQMLEQKTKEERKASRESEDIVAREYSKRYQLALQHQRELEDLETEKKEWQKKNPNRTIPKYFAQREEVIELKFKADFAKLDEEFNEWIEGIQRETGNIDFSNFIDDLQLEIDIEPSYEIRKEKIDKRREAELRKVKEEGNRNKTEQLKEQFGDKSIELYNKLQEDGANREELLKGYAKDLHTDVTILEQVMQQIDSASKALDAQTAAQVSAKRRGFENEDIQGVYSEYYAIGEGLANYAGYELKKKAIADKYNELRGKAELVKDKGTKEKMLATFSDMQDKELKQLENNFFMSLTTTNADGSEMSIAERLMGKNGNVKLIETVRLLKLLKKAKQEIDGSNDKKVSSETSNAITDLTGLSADEIESLAANSNDMAVAWGGVRDAISSSVTELSNINTGNQGIDQVLLGISQAAEIATDETAGLSDKINSSVNIIFNTLSGAFQMVAETMSMIGEASHDGEIMETAEVFSGIAQNFSAAAQGAATGGWVGAIVGGVTDALGQIINAVVQNISAAHEAKVAYQQWADAAREVSYSQSLQSKNNIFGENNVDKLTTALDTLRKVKDDYLETTKGLEEASQKDAEELKKLLSEKNALIAGITMASISIVGLTNAQMWKDWERNKQALDEYKDSLYEVLVGGFYKNGKQNIDGFVKAIENGYSALEAMQIKTLDKSGSSKDEYKALKDLAPEVFNEDGSIDTEMLDAFMQAYGDKLTEEQRMLLEQLKVQQDAYNEAFEQATEYYANLFGNVGTSLMDAFESEMVRGEDALDSFTDSIADAVEEWVRQFAYMAYIQPYLMDATKMIEDAVSAEGATTESINAAMDEALAYIFGNFNEMQDGYTAFLQDAQGKYGDMFGMDLFQDEDAEGSQGFGKMTQDQADTLTARFTAVQIEMANVSATTQAMAGVVSLVGEDVKLGVAGIQSLLYNSNIALQMAQDQLDQMQIIADNTAMLNETNNRLKAIEQNTSKL